MSAAVRPSAAPVVRAGVLALQGDVEPHAACLRAAGAEPRPVTRVAHLDGIGLLVLPGGESTTLLRLMEDEPWFDALRRFHDGGGALLATCAGTILLARDVSGPAQPSVGLLDVGVRRNAYGRQVQSFECELDVPALGAAPLPVAFIRAPRIVEVGPGVTVLARVGDDPVLVRQGRIVAATMHPEVAGDPRLHAMALGLREAAA